MTIAWFFETLTVGGLGGIVVGTIVALVGKSYLKEKGKNIATKEDIDEITRKVEEAKQPFFEIQEHIKSSHQLRFAAIDKRLQTHQEAFTMWIKLMQSVHTENKSEVVRECQAFWQNNCLYLDAAVRDALTTAIFAAQTHAYWLKESAPSEADENWKKIMAFPDVLFNAIKLTPISQQDLGQLSPQSTSDDK